MTKENILFIALIIFLIALAGFGPVITILSLNLLFNLSIPITIWTWLATAWLGAFFTAHKFKKN